MRDGWEDTTLGAFITQSKKKVKVLHGEVYPAVGVMMEGRGFVTREPFIGGKTTYKQLTPIEPNQLVLRSITAWEAPIQVTTDDHVGFHVSGVFPVFDIDSAKINPRFLGLHCQYNPFWESMRERTVGSVLRRKTLSAKALMEIPIELPPLPEQQRIVDLISTVDSYIEALRQQLERAMVSRNAVLHELLTAGGDGWVQTTLGDVAEVVGGGTPSTSVPEYWDGDIVWLTPTEVTSQDGKIVTDSTRKITSAGLRGSGAQLLPKGSVVLTSRASVGYVAIAGTELCTNQGFQSLVPRESVLAEFLLFWVQRNRSEFESRSAGSTFKEISKSNVKSIKLSVPPMPEQKRIVGLASTVDSYIDALEGQINSSMSLRSGLLSDLLSGNHEIPASYDQLIGAA